MKPRDTIVEEQHRVRERIGRAHGFDIDRIAAAVRAHETAADSRVARRAPKRAARQKRTS